MTNISPYQPGGTLIEGSYVLRAADEELKKAILENTLYPYLLAPRQSGKSSVLVHTKTELRSDNLEIVVVDLSEFEPKSLDDYDEFIESFIELIISELSKAEFLREKIATIRKKPRFFLQGIRTIMRSLSGRLVICIDEIDKLRQCSFKDIFLGQVRALFNRRTTDSNLKRLQFVLAGAVSHEDLISDIRQSPFNVGTSVALDDLSLNGIQKLVAVGWPQITSDTEDVVGRLRYWTSGSVYLCQEILHRVYREGNDRIGLSLYNKVESTVKSMIRKARDEVHFRNIAQNLKANNLLFNQWLSWTDGEFPDESALRDLLVVGICGSDKPYKNRIYERVFSRNGILDLGLSNYNLDDDTAINGDSNTRKITKTSLIHEKANQFERDVERIYQYLGYRTQNNVSLFGQQIDIVASKYVDGIGTIQIFIECKYRTHGSVSNQDVYNFISSTDNIKRHAEFSKGVLVSNVDFTSAAKSLKNNSVGLMTLRELENEVLNFEKSFIEEVSDYESSASFNDYVPLMGQSDHLKGILNLDEWLLDCLTNSSDTISILGDFGSGKSTLMQRLRYSIVKLYLERKTDRKPILLELKNFHKFENITQFLISNFFTQYKRELPEALLKKEIEHGKIIFLFDGLDEMSGPTNQSKRLSNFSLLMPLLRGNCPACITCRPSYFVSKIEYSNYVDSFIKVPELSFHSANFKLKTESLYSKLKSAYIEKEKLEKLEKQTETINIKQFSREQIDCYLKNFNHDFVSKCKSNWEEVNQFLSETYDLLDLMSRPLLLKMIKDTILWLGDNFKNFNSADFNPASLYEIYTAISLELDWEKAEVRDFLSKNQRSRYVEFLAIQMFDHQTLEVEIDALRKLASICSDDTNLLKEEKQHVTIEDIVSDIQICSFITRTSDDTFRFVHKSFLEFFVAKFIVAELRQNKVDSRFQTRLSKEVLYFIGSYAAIDYSIQTKLLDELNKGDERYQRNIVASLFLSNSQHRRLKIIDAKLDDLTFKRIALIDCVIKNANFLQVQFSEISFSKADLTVSFRECTFNAVLFEEITGHLTFSSCEIIDSKISSTKEILQLRIDEAMLTNTYIECAEISYSLLQLSNSIFSRVTFNSYNEKSNLEFNNCNFSDCFFAGIEFNSNTANRIDLASCFKSCTGICFVNFNFDQLAGSDLEFNEKGVCKIGDLLLINLNRYASRKNLVKRLCTSNLYKRNGHSQMK